MSDRDVAGHRVAKVGSLTVTLLGRKAAAELAGAMERRRGQLYAFAGDRFTSSDGALDRFKVEDGAVAIDHPIAQPEARDLNRFRPAGGDEPLLESWPSVEAFRGGGRSHHCGIAMRDGPN